MPVEKVPGQGEKPGRYHDSLENSTKMVDVSRLP